MVACAARDWPGRLHRGGAFDADQALQSPGELHDSGDGGEVVHRGEVARVARRGRRGGWRRWAALVSTGGDLAGRPWSGGGMGKGERRQGWKGVGGRD